MHDKTWHSDQLKIMTGIKKNIFRWSQAALSLQAAAGEFLQAHNMPGSHFATQVILTSSCEIDGPCRDVLSKTFGPVTKGKHCMFPDILKIDKEKGYAFCLAHNKNCPLEKPARQQRLLAQLAARLMFLNICHSRSNEVFTDCHYKTATDDEYEVFQALCLVYVLQYIIILCVSMGRSLGWN